MSPTHKEVWIANQNIKLPGDLAVPSNAVGLVIFAHGSGSSRRSPRNMQVARVLNQVGLATLLFDLLTPDESDDRQNVFDISLLANRLIMTTQWVLKQAQLKQLPIGYFGASTGAAAALQAAAKLGTQVTAVVSRGGRPDLTGPGLELVKCPTLLLVGEEDDAVLDMNREVLPLLAKGELMTIPGATHLFEEPGTLEQVANEAAQWFTRFLKQKRHKAA